MTSVPPPPPQDFTALATEACDLWQQYLTQAANNDEAKSAVAQMLEPQRQFFAKLFADAAGMRQNAAHAATANPDSTQPPAAPTGAPPAAVTPDDVALRLAQLAHRVAQLERDNRDLEQRLAELDAKLVPGNHKA